MQCAIGNWKCIILLLPSFKFLYYVEIVLLPSWEQLFPYKASVKNLVHTDSIYRQEKPSSEPSGALHAAMALACSGLPISELTCTTKLN